MNYYIGVVEILVWHPSSEVSFYILLLVLFTSLWFIFWKFHLQSGFSCFNFCWLTSSSFILPFIGFSVSFSLIIIVWTACVFSFNNCNNLGLDILHIPYNEICYLKKTVIFFAYFSPPKIFWSSVWKCEILGFSECSFKPDKTRNSESMWSHF